MNTASEKFESIFKELAEWPYKDMVVGEVVEISENAKRAQVYAHSYGAANGMKFSTRTDKATGNLYVKRIK